MDVNILSGADVQKGIVQFQKEVCFHISIR